MAIRLFPRSSRLIGIEDQMHRFALLTVFAAIACAQSDNPFDRPPADVDKALRARIQEFFGYHVTGEFRKAEAMVAEDTKDYFYLHNKLRYISIEIAKIKYSENYTKANAIVLCEQVYPALGFGDKPIMIPTPSTWKLENGKWMWWVDPEKVGESPFGRMKPGPDTAGAKTPAPLPPNLANMPNSTDFLFDQVKLDKNSVSLKPGESASVSISNAAPGTMTVSIRTKLPGIEASLDKSSLAMNEKAILTIKATPAARPGSLELQIDPIGQVLRVQVAVSNPAPEATPGPAVPTAPPVTLDKNAVSLKRGGSATVTISSSAPGATTLLIQGRIPGIEAKLDKSSLQSGEKALLTIKATNAAKPGALVIRADPAGQTLPVQVSVK